MSSWLDRQEAELVADDQAAIIAHLSADATGGHQFLAQQIWHIAHALGVPPGGHVLATGLDAAVFVGTTTPKGDGPSASVWDVPVRWRAMAPPQWPYPALTVDPAPEPAGARVRGPFAVQIVSQVGLDVRARSMMAWAYQQRRFHEQLTHALTSAAPGGLVVALASHTILDTPNRDRWEQAGRVADFLGAARLPSHALRTDARCDAPFDLMVFRRRPLHAVAQASRESGLDSGLVVPGTVVMQGGNLPVSSYYGPQSEHVLGIPIVRTDRWDMDHLTVLDADQTWRTRLPQVLDQIAHAHTPGFDVASGAAPVAPLRPVPGTARAGAPERPPRPQDGTMPAL